MLKAVLNSVAILNRQIPSIALAKPPKQAHRKPRFRKSLADKALDSHRCKEVKALG